MRAQEIHGHLVVGSVYAETQSTGRCYVVTVDRGEGTHQRFVTGWYRDGADEWSNGHYFDSYAEAIWDMTARVVGPQAVSR